MISEVEDPLFLNMDMHWEGLPQTLFFFEFSCDLLINTSVTEAVSDVVENLVKQNS